MKCEHEWIDRSANRSAEWVCTKCKKPFTQVQPSTTTKRPWVGLTDEEIKAAWRVVETSDFYDCVVPLSRAIEARLREKNI
jgi:hypothetical protein